MRRHCLILVLFLLAAACACNKPKSGEGTKKIVAKIETPVKKPPTPQSTQQTEPKVEQVVNAVEPQSEPKDAIISEAAVTQPPQEPDAEMKPSEEQSEDQITLKDVQRKTKEAIITIEAYVASKEREYHQKIDAQFVRFDERLNRLRDSARQLSEDAKKRVSQEVRELQANLENTQQNLLGKLEVSNEDDVKQLEQNLNKMVAQMEQSLAKVKP